MTLRHPVIYVYEMTYLSMYMYSNLRMHIDTITGGRELIGCLKLQAIFRERATN